jgi:hypothetical protein
MVQHIMLFILLITRRMVLCGHAARSTSVCNNLRRLRHVWALESLTVNFPGQGTVRADLTDPGTPWVADSKSVSLKPYSGISPKKIRRQIR